MKLINFKGLNCYSNSIISIVNEMNIDYARAFSNLWSETDFSYDPHRKMYSSKRMLENLAILGVRYETLPCGSQLETEQSFSTLTPGTNLVIGMNAFHIPWNPHFGLFSGPHYFIARYETGDSVRCYDPSNGVADGQLPIKMLITHTSDLGYLRPDEHKEQPLTIQTELIAVAETHQDMLQKLISWFESCYCDGRSQAEQAAHYVVCLMNHRYLFKYFLKHCQTQLTEKIPGFNDDFFEDWTAVKNGLLKIAIVRENHAIIDAVCRKTAVLIDSEIKTAQNLLTTLYKEF